MSDLSHGSHAVALREDVWDLAVTQLMDRLSASLEVAAPAPPIGGPDARSGGDSDRQAERPKAAWSVDGRWSSGGVLTLEMRSGGRTYVLTLQDWEREREGQPIGPLAMLDGEELDYSPLQILQQPLIGGPEFRLEGIAGTSLGKLSFSMHRGMLNWVMLRIDGEWVYQHGHPSS